MRAPMSFFVFWCGHFRGKNYCFSLDCSFFTACPRVFTPAALQTAVRRVRLCSRLPCGLYGAGSPTTGVCSRELGSYATWGTLCCMQLSCCICSHINSHNQVRGHKTGSSHSGGEKYPSGKHKQPKVVHAYIAADAIHASTRNVKK